jgi:hypothetical protein
VAVSDSLRFAASRTLAAWSNTGTLAHRALKWSARTINVAAIVNLTFAFFYAQTAIFNHSLPEVATSAKSFAENAGRATWYIPT